MADVRKGFDTDENKEWEFVTIPKLDLYDRPRQTIWINAERFEPGQTYKVDPAHAFELRRIIKALELSDIRMLRPQVCQKSIDQVAEHGVSGTEVAPVTVR